MRGDRFWTLLVYGVGWLLGWLMGHGIGGFGWLHGVMLIGLTLRTWRGR
jgi:hypothetical protein